jgi:hypothetical protein
VGKMIVRNSTIGPHIMAATPWQAWLSSNGNRAVPAAQGDGGADAGALTPMVISAVLYTSAEYHEYQPYFVEDWPNGPYRTEGVVGTRPGGPIAGAWAIMKFLGEDGFMRTTARIMQVKEQLSAGINEIPGLRDAAARLAGGDSPARLASAIEFVLEGLHLSNRLNKTTHQGKAHYARA